MKHCPSASLYLGKGQGRAQQPSALLLGSLFERRALHSPLCWGHQQRGWVGNKLFSSTLNSFLALFQVHCRVCGRACVASLVLLGQSPSDCPECVGGLAIAGRGGRSVHLMSTGQGLSHNPASPQPSQALSPPNTEFSSL